MLDTAPQGAILDTTASHYRQGYYQKGDTMQAIQTKFFGPTNTRGSRIKASCWLTSVTVSWDHSANSEENHTAAIEALVGKLNNDRVIEGNTRLWQEGNTTLWEVVATGESVDGKGKTAIIDLK